MKHDFAERYARAWCGQDPAEVARFFTESGALTVNDGEPAVGRQAITEVARGFMEAFPDMIVTFDRLEPIGDRFRFHWTLSGTNSGPGGTGMRVRISGHETWQLGVDGLIADSIGSYDEVEYARQLREGFETRP